jgi:hypothetical protein
MTGGCSPFQSHSRSTLAGLLNEYVGVNGSKPLLYTVGCLPTNSAIFTILYCGQNFNIHVLDVKITVTSDTTDASDASDASVTNSGGKFQSDKPRIVILIRQIQKCHSER